MSHIKLIKTAKDHEIYLGRLMDLMDEDPAPGTLESDEIDVLALVIERYEQENYPLDPPDPIEAILFRMDQQVLKKKDLVPFIGSAPKVTEVLNGTRTLSLNMIRKLSVGLGISAEVLIREKEQKEAQQPEIDWQLFPLSEMRKRGYFEDVNESLVELKEYAAERMSSFIGIVTNGFSLEPAMLRTSAHLRSNNKETDHYSLWAWQIRILQKAQQERLSQPYDKGVVNRDWMRKLAQLSWSEQGPLLAQEYLNNSGIHLIIEPHLPKTYLDGAVCLSESGNPVVALTLRHNRLDNFWFSLMHELAHIALHVDGTEVWYLDDLDSDGGDKVELQADALAQETLIPEQHCCDLEGADADTVRQLAKNLEISPCIIAGRARHEARNHSMFGSLFRDKVRDHFHCCN